MILPENPVGLPTISLLRYPDLDNLALVFREKRLVWWTSSPVLPWVGSWVGFLFDNFEFFPKASRFTFESFGKKIKKFYKKI